jgi:hypothetical protein
VVYYGKPLQVPPPRSGRQPDVRTPSWVESPTSLEVMEARVLLAEICLLKERGLIAEAVVADFVFKNIQPLKDRAYPTYLSSAPVCDEVPAEVLSEVDPNGGIHVEVDPNGCNHAEAEPNGCDHAEADPNGCDHAKADPNGCDRAEVEPNGCDRAPAVVRIFYEDEEEEEEVPLIHKNSRHYRGSRGDSDIPSPALFALVSLQELSITDFDQALEDIVPEDMLSKSTADDMMDVCSKIPNMGLEVSRAVSRVSSTLEGSLRCQDVGQDCPNHMEVTEDPSALEVAVAENLAPRVVPAVTQPPRVSPVVIRL